MPLPVPVGFLYWYTTSIILGILTLLNILTKLYSYFTRPTEGSTTPLTCIPAPVISQISQDSDSEASKPVKPELGTLSRATRAAKVLAEKYVVLTALPLPKLRWWIKRAAKSSVPTSELAWQGGYVIGILVLSFWGGALSFVHET